GSAPAGQPRRGFVVLARRFISWTPAPDIRGSLCPMQVSDFDYELPPDRIAQEPLPERDASRLLLLDRRTGGIAHHRFRELPDLLRPDDVLVVNDSKVIPARLHGRKTTGGQAEVLLVRPLAEREWLAMTRPGLPPGGR